LKSLNGIITGSLVLPEQITIPYHHLFTGNMNNMNDVSIILYLLVEEYELQTRPGDSTGQDNIQRHTLEIEKSMQDGGFLFNFQQ
jgi:hypothetical protein